MTSRDFEMSPSSAASSGGPVDGQDAWLDLVSEELSTGLGDEERASLAAVLASLPGKGFGKQIEDWERVASEVALATAVEQYEPLPEHLRRKLQIEAVSMLPMASAAGADAAGLPAVGNDETAVVKPRPVVMPREAVATHSRETLAWMAAAVALLVAVLGWMPVWQTGPVSRPSALPEPSIASQRAALLGDPNAAVVQLSWSATDDEAVREVDDLGDVVFNPVTQEGYMRLRGLAANDASVEQYQLWVFDAERDERYPVDGGVFDVPAGVDEVVVPIRTAIAVNNPTLFAITVEKPGGVVVSSRERLPLLAQAADAG